MNYEIAKRIKFRNKYILSSSFEIEEDVSSYIYIVKLGNKFGIFSGNKEELVPCEYDNITLLHKHNDIFQLVKNGKIGIAHIEESDDEYPSQQLKIITPCEYDSLTSSPSLSILVLKKDEFEGQKCRAYFPLSNMLTDWYDSYNILDRGLIELYNTNGNELHDAFFGKMILKHNNFSYGQIDVLINDTNDPDDDVFENFGSVIFTFGDRSSLIYYDRKTMTQFFYNGDVHPIYGTDFCEAMNSPLAVGFVIEDKEKGLILLDKHCNLIRIDDPAWIKIKSQVEVYGSRYHEITEYPFSSNCFYRENIIEALFGDINEFLESP